MIVKEIHRKNNLDFLRLIFASFVIVTHSYSITGIQECDWLCQVSKNQLGLSWLGVKGFFIISGFLIFQSLTRSKNLEDYYWKRGLRLFPALLVVLLATVVLASFVYENEATPYLFNSSVWSYVPKNLTLYNLQYGIEGVFENNPLNSAINGSLWTISYEFTMYMLLSLLFLIKKRERVIKILLTLSVAILILVNLINTVFYVDAFNFITRGVPILNGALLLDLGTYFIAGSFLAAFKFDKHKHVNTIVYASLLILLISIPLNFFSLVKYITLPALIIGFGLKSTPFINNIGNRLGDLSYGIYIYGFPVQQALVYFFELDYLQLMFLSLPISFFLAYLSWHLVEVKALRFKNLPPSIYLRQSFGFKNRDLEREQKQHA